MASRGLNKVMLIGNLGADPEMRYANNGNAIANVNIATTRSRKNKDTGDWEDETDWHRVVFFQRQAEIVGEFLKKGSQVYIEGRLQTRKWQDKEGQDRWTTEIVASDMKMLGGRGESAGGNYSGDARTASSPSAPSAPSAPSGGGGGGQAAAPAPAAEFDDDIPF